MIKNILFDMGGVVFIQDTPRALERFRSMGLDAERYLGVYGHEGIFRALERGELSCEEFCVELAKLCGRESLSWAEAQWCWLGYIDSVPRERLEYIRALRSRYTVGMLSNTNPFILEDMKGGEWVLDGGQWSVTDCFDYTFYSCELGLYKPEPAIYKRALELGGMRAEETLSVDNSLENVRAAEALGIKGLYVETNEDWRETLEAKLKNCD